MLQSLLKGNKFVFGFCQPTKTVQCIYLAFNKGDSEARKNVRLMFRTPKDRMTAKWNLFSGYEERYKMVWKYLHVKCDKTAMFDAFSS